jgi:hypothetical protein
MALKQTFEIKFPEEKTYWIFWTDKVSQFVYGWTEPTQVTDTSQPNWWTTTSEAEWIYKLETEFNTNLFPPEPITDNNIEQ